MLDKRAVALLSAINNECEGSGYRIFSFNELISLLPSYVGFEIEGIKEHLTTLSDNEFISVKYEDDNEICLRPLIKGRVAIENVREKAQSETSLKKSLLLFAFLGGLFGGILNSLLLYIVLALGGI